MLLWSRGLLRARSRFPEIVRNIRKRSKGMESLERGLVLAKQVLYQLSYTPTREAVLILKHFPTFLPLHFMVSSLYRARTAVHLSPHCTRTVLIGCAAQPANRVF